MLWLSFLSQHKFTDVMHGLRIPVNKSQMSWVEMQNVRSSRGKKIKTDISKIFHRSQSKLQRFSAVVATIIERRLSAFKMKRLFRNNFTWFSINLCVCCTFYCRLFRLILSSRHVCVVFLLDYVCRCTFTFFFLLCFNAAFRSNSVSEGIYFNEDNSRQAIVFNKVVRTRQREKLISKKVFAMFDSVVSSLLYHLVGASLMELSTYARKTVWARSVTCEDGTK